MQKGNMGFQILDKVIEKDQNGRPEQAQFGKNAKDLFEAVSGKYNTSIEMFCAAVKELHIASLVDADGKIEPTNIMNGLAKVTATQNGVRKYLEIVLPGMNFLK